MWPLHNITYILLLIYSRRIQSEFVAGDGTLKVECVQKQVVKWAADETNTI